MAKIIAIVGKSSSGKDKTFSELLNQMPNQLKPIISHTSRPPRDNEQRGREYHFVSQEDMIDMIGREQTIEHRTYETEYGTWLYAIHKDSVDMSGNKTYIVIVDPKGLIDLQNYFSSENVYSFLIDAKPYIRKMRSLSREDFLQMSEKEQTKKILEIDRRFSDDEKRFHGLKGLFDFHLNNNTIEDFEFNINFIKQTIDNLER